VSPRPTLRERRQQAFLALMVAHDAQQRRTHEFMKGFGLTVHQYNVLRILRGAGPEGKPSQSIAADMISKVPDVTRLVDRLSAAGLAARRPDPDDRRVVRVVILPKGLDLLARMDEPIHDLHAQVLADLSAEELATLTELLARI